MGWRIGYIAYPAALGDALLAVQDTIPICPTRISQQAALGALEAGRAWVDERTAPLAANLSALRGALAPLPAVHGGEGAFFFISFFVCSFLFLLLIFFYLLFTLKARSTCCASCPPRSALGRGATRTSCAGWRIATA